MMRAQLDDVHERGEPVAILWASEETIYGRFGYGMASFSGRSSTASGARPPSRRAGPRADRPPRDVDEAAELFPPIYERLRASRPG